MIFLPIFAHYFQFNLDEISLFLNEGKLNFIGVNENQSIKKLQQLKVSITVLKISVEIVVNIRVIFLSKECLVQPIISGNNLVTKYGMREGYCGIPNKAS